MTLCNGGKSQPQGRRGAGRRKVIEVKSPLPEMNGSFLVSRMERAFARDVHCPGPTVPTAGKYQIRTSVRIVSWVLLLTFLLYPRFEHSNLMSDLWS